MKRVINNMFLVVTLMFALTGISCAAEYQEGKHYKRIDTQKTANPDKVEVLEFFWYGCPHCYQFEPHIKQWKKNKPSNSLSRLFKLIRSLHWPTQGFRMNI